MTPPSISKLSRDERTQIAAETRLRAEAGDYDAMYRLSWLYRRGEGVAHDQEQADYWLMEAGAGCEMADSEGLLRAEKDLKKSLAERRRLRKQSLKNPKDSQAFRDAFAAAEAGDIPSMLLISNYYSQGVECRKDFEEGMHWLMRAAAEGSAEAVVRINGLGRQKALQQFMRSWTEEEWRIQQQRVKEYEARKLQARQLLARECAAIAAAKAARLAQAWQVEQARIASERLAEAARIGQVFQAAEAGDVEAMLEVGNRCADGNGVTKDEAKSIFWYGRATKFGNIQAANPLQKAFAAACTGSHKGLADSMSILAECYEQGHGTAACPKRSAAWLAQAADAGHAESKAKLQAAYDAVTGGDLGEMAHAWIRGESVVWLRVTANDDYGSAMFRLGRLLAAGTEVRSDAYQAYQWFVKAGQSRAGYELQRLLPALRGVAERIPSNGVRDIVETLAAWGHDSEAAWWRLRLAGDGDPEALASHGRALELGRGVTRDLIAAREHYARAAALGHAEAMFWLGEMIEYGQGGAKSDSDARIWYAKAAATGHEPARRALD